MLANKQKNSVAELAEMICERMGATPRFVYSSDVRPDDAQRWRADISWLKRLDYQPRVGLAEELADTVARFRKVQYQSPINGIE